MDAIENLEQFERTAMNTPGVPGLLKMRQKWNYYQNPMTMEYIRPNRIKKGSEKCWECQDSVLKTIRNNLFQIRYLKLWVVIFIRWLCDLGYQDFRLKRNVFSMRRLKNFTFWDYFDSLLWDFFYFLQFFDFLDFLSFFNPGDISGLDSKTFK